MDVNTLDMELFYRAIRRSPDTLANLQYTDAADPDYRMYGPGLLGIDELAPRFGFSDDLIEALLLGKPVPEISSKVDYAGGYVGAVNDQLTGIKVVPFMMLMARSLLILPTEVVEGVQTWVADPDIKEDINSIMKSVHGVTDELKNRIDKILCDGSAVEAGQRLYDKIHAQYL